MRFRRTLLAIAPRLLVAALALIAVPLPLAAQDSVYTVSGVPVDATAATANEAREQAIAQAHVAAMQALLQRLVVDGDRTRLPQFSPDQIAQYVRDFSVANEKAASGRYIADFTFRFNSASMRTLFQQYGVRFAETQSKPLVVLPLWGSDQAFVLWEETNPWLAAWAGRSFDEGLVPLTIPLGDLGDVSTISSAQAVSGDVERMSQLAARYGAGGVLVAQASPLGDEAAGDASVGVTISRLAEGRFEPVGVETFQQRPDEDMSALLTRAAQGVAAAEEARWRDANLLNFGSRQTVLVRVPITDLDSWLQVRRRLESVAMVVAADLRYLRRDRADLSLTFMGDEEQLARALAQNDLRLSRSLPVAPTYGEVTPTTGGTVGYGQTAPATVGGGGYGQGGRSASGYGAVVSRVEPSWELRLEAGATRKPAAGQGLPRDGSGSATEGVPGAAEVGVEAVEPLPEAQ